MKIKAKILKKSTNHTLKCFGVNCLYYAPVGLSQEDKISQ